MVKEGIGITGRDFVKSSAGNPLVQARADEVDEDLHLLQEGNVPVGVSDFLAAARPVAVGPLYLLQGKLLPNLGEGRARSL